MQACPLPAQQEQPGRRGRRRCVARWQRRDSNRSAATPLPLPRTCVHNAAGLSKRTIKLKRLLLTHNNLGDPPDGAGSEIVKALTVLISALGKLPAGDGVPTLVDLRHNSFTRADLESLDKAASEATAVRVCLGTFAGQQAAQVKCERRISTCSLDELKFSEQQVESNGRLRPDDPCWLNPRVGVYDQVGVLP